MCEKFGISPASVVVCALSIVGERYDGQAIIHLYVGEEKAGLLSLEMEEAGYRTGNASGTVYVYSFPGDFL